MNELFNIISFALIGVSFGMFTSFIDDCFYPDMIFERYGRWVASLGWWGKPIGGCPLCFNFWVTTVFFLSFFGLDFLGIIVTIAFSHFTISYLVLNKKPKNYTMKCCCESVYNLGCIGSCEAFDLEFTTDANEDFTLLFTTNGVKQSVNIKSDLNKITVPYGIVNENASSVLSVFDSDNEKISFNIEGVDYDCILFQTKIIL